MKKRFAIAGTLLCVIALSSCSGHRRHHKTPLGDPAAYDVHFPDMDANGDGQVDKSEFKTQFPQSDDHVFKALDLDDDGAVDHDEWHQFKEAHGMKRHS